MVNLFLRCFFFGCKLPNLAICRMAWQLEILFLATGNFQANQENWLQYLYSGLESTILSPFFLNFSGTSKYLYIIILAYIRKGRTQV